jgi:DNA polymerase I-like protein with 3'-5' exonuclease and polymerase domains
MHDEALAEMEPEHVDDHVQRWVQAGEDITEGLGLRVPLIFDSKIGDSYAECH